MRPQPAPEQDVQGETGVDHGDQNVQAEEQIAHEEGRQRHEERQPAIREAGSAEQSQCPDRGEVRRVRDQPGQDSRDDQRDKDQKAVAVHCCDSEARGRRPTTISCNQETGAVDPGPPFTLAKQPRLGCGFRLRPLAPDAIPRPTASLPWLGRRGTEHLTE